MQSVSRRFDGAYSLVFLNAQGDMLVARDPLGIKPLVLRERRAAVCRRQRERGPAEPGFHAGEHPVAAAGPGDHDYRRRPL